MKHRIQKLLSNFGYCSRRKAEELIINGQVKINGITAKIGDSADENDSISVNNKDIKKQKKIYLMFNKPIGCITAVKDNKFKTVLDYIKINERVYPIGRLDFNTSGLLILTNDGDFANKIMHPKNEIKKTYFVKLNKAISSKELKRIEEGIYLENNTKTSKSKIKQINETTLEITIHEGKKRIIRRIFKKLGYKVVILKRIKIGSLELKNLKEGNYKILTENEIKFIFK